jgi:hypothetical protein
MVLRASSESRGFSDAETLPELMGRTMIGFAPGSIQFGFVLNSRSFRTREYEPGPARDRFRVVALGDSFTFASGGLPHQDHWTTLLEAELDGQGGQAVEVLRLGVPDTGPAFQLRLWQIEAAALRPDAVVLGFFIGNDFVDHQEDCGRLCESTPSLGKRLASVSSLYRACRNLIRIHRADPGGARTESARSGSLEPGTAVPGYADAFDPDQPTFERADFVAIEARRMALCLRSEREAFERLLANAVQVIVQLKSEVEGTGAWLVVMLIPDQYQIDDVLVDEVLRMAGTEREDYDLDWPQRRLVEALAPFGVEVLDLLPLFRAQAAPNRLYRPNDTHWNRAGNRIGASALARMLATTAHDDPQHIFSDGFEGPGVDSWAPGAAPDGSRDRHVRHPTG